MSNYYDSPQYGGVIPAIEANVSERTTFIRKTYLHVLGAVIAFMAIETIVFQMFDASSVNAKMNSSPYMWLAVMGAYMVVGSIADYWARSSTSRSMQYVGLGVYVLMES